MATSSKCLDTSSDSDQEIEDRDSMKECGLSPPRAKKTRQLAGVATFELIIFIMVGEIMNDISVTLKFYFSV